MSRRTTINLIWFAFVAALFAVWAVNNIISFDFLDRPYAIKADFASSVGLQPQAEVDYLGVSYGQVESVDLIPGGVRVTMEIKRGKRIPAGSSAHIFRKSAIGEQYVNFVPPAAGPAGRWMEAGDRVPMSRTTVPLEFSELLRSASRLISGIPPEDVRSLVHELAVGLSGRTDSLRMLAESGDRIGQTLADRTELLDRLMTNNTRVTRVLTEHRGSLGQSLTDLRQVADSLRAARGDVAVLLDRGSRLLAITTPIVARQKGNLDCDLKVLDNVIRQTAEAPRLASLRNMLAIAPDAFDAFFDTRDIEADGTVWWRVGLVNDRTRPAPQYVPVRDLPPVPAVPSCRSPLRPVTLDYAPAAASTPLDSPSAALLVGLAMALVGGAAVVRESSGLRSRP